MISTASSNHRLLYRGALELPDSFILLDGLSFTLQLGAKDNRPKSSPNMDLLQNPLPLALESMRGRPSLLLLGPTKVKDVFIDSSCDANVFIHQNSALTRLYFENILCLSSVTSLDGKTEYGIRVGLGDQVVPGSSEILIYGYSNNSPQAETPAELRLFAARIVPAPPPLIRLPRPDDPTPRKPPLFFFGEKNAQKNKKAKDDGISKRVTTIPNPAKGPSRTSSKNAFKVPDIPIRVNGATSDGNDVFGSINQPRGKTDEIKLKMNSEELDKKNKAEVKKSAVQHLARYGITKETHNFKDLFGFVYRGASFALRLHMNSRILDSQTIDKLVELHTQIYVRGDGVLSKPP